MSSPNQNRFAWLAPLVLWAAVFLLLMSISMAHPLDHDEHQFIASGALLARRGLLPYRDYPYFHLPNLVLIYAALFKCSSYLLLCARLFNAACTTCTVVIVFALANRLYAPFGAALKTVMAFAAAICLMCNPIFVYTVGKAWNHDLPVLLTMLAVLALWRWNSSSAASASKWAITCGLLLGLAAGVRLTFAASVIAFAISMLVSSSKPWLERLSALRLLSAGVALSLAPSLILFAIAPRQFVFGNFEYPSLNTLYFQLRHYSEAMTLSGKLNYFATQLLAQPAIALLAIAFCASMAGFRIAKNDSRHPHQFKMISVALLAVALFVSSFAPTPSRVQYFFSGIPFAVLFVLLAAADQRSGPRPFGLHLTVVVMLLASWDARPYQEILSLTKIKQRVPLEVHALGQELAARTHAGRILTYAPLVPLEGGCDIYEEFATGPFAARVADLVKVPVRQQHKLVDINQLHRTLDLRVPNAVLGGFEPELDVSLRESAWKSGYRSDFQFLVANSRNDQVWLMVRVTDSRLITVRSRAVTIPEQPNRARASIFATEIP